MIFEFSYKSEITDGTPRVTLYATWKVDILVDYWHPNHKKQASIKDYKLLEIISDNQKYDVEGFLKDECIEQFNNRRDDVFEQFWSECRP